MTVKGGITRCTRRGALKYALAAAVAGLPVFNVARAARPRVVVVGGGAGGAIVAHYLAEQSSGAVEVTLVERHRRYTSCFLSNWHLGGLRSFDYLTHSYHGLAAAGVRVLHAQATGVDGGAKRLSLADGTLLPYDRLVVSPGIDFRYREIEGYGPEAARIMPHGYSGGEQISLLQQQLAAMKDGGVFLITAPDNPFRCPAAPYERASMAAHYLKARNPTAKILILDAKSSFTKEALFLEAWHRYYDGMIEWLPGDMLGGGVAAVDTGQMTVTAGGEVFRGDVVNIIPPQKAGGFAAAAGLTDDSGWCPVNPLTFESVKLPGVHVIGDAVIGGDMPKSASSAQSQARVCAWAVQNLLTGAPLSPPDLNHICWSLLAPGDGVKVGAAYGVEAEGIVQMEGFASSTGESAELRAQTAEETLAWYDAVTADMFG